MLMGGWAQDAEDSRGNRPTPWTYAFQLDGSYTLRALHLFQAKVQWEDTYNWKPSRRSPIPTATPPAAGYLPGG